VLIKDYPRFVLRRAWWRIAVYQSLWKLYAITKNPVAYLRGVRAAIRGRRNMRAKSRELMAKRRISDEEFLRRLIDSERQIWEWQQSKAPNERSVLLKIYFALTRR
jgi:hypothetical protein